MPSDYLDGFLDGEFVVRDRAAPVGDIEGSLLSDLNGPIVHEVQDTRKPPMRGARGTSWFEGEVRYQGSWRMFPVSKSLSDDSGVNKTCSSSDSQ